MMIWYKKILSEKKTELIQASILSLLSTVLYTIFSFRYGHHFSWEPIEPIDQPSILARALYSAIVYVGPGALIYNLGFYKVLHDIIVKTLGLWRLYKRIKWTLWITLMLFAYWLVGVAVDITNSILSTGYNIGRLVLFISPVVGAFGFSLLAILLTNFLIAYKHSDSLASKSDSLKL